MKTVVFDLQSSNVLVGEVQYLHYSGISHGVEMRAEVGLLSRNIKIQGDMEDNCYSDNFCEYFDYDTHGGQTQVCVRRLLTCALL